MNGRLSGYRTKSPHRTLILEKKILPPIRPGLSPRSFDHESCALTTELSPSASILKQRDKETNDTTGVWRLSRQRGNRWRLHYFDWLLHRHHLHVRPSRWAIHTHTRCRIIAAVRAERRSCKPSHETVTVHGAQQSYLYT